MSWRDDSSLISKSFYKKRFAIWPVTCADSSRVWLKVYYKKYQRWSHDCVSDAGYGVEYSHTDFVESVTEDEYLIRKLAETL